ncbi:MAG: hypothetical protein HY002_03885 [Candidatus Rokubacteria bacterium]|nr:hypothetical protein [Candidatus Rokubacteria bacterium]
MNPSGAPWDNCRAVVAGLALVVLGVLVFVPAAAAEDFEATHCAVGTFTAYQGSQELKLVFTWAQNGIVRSPNKLFDNAATYCAGVQRGVLPMREGYALCKVVDADGDIIVWGGTYTGPKLSWPFLEGTGKWKGITGGFESDRVASAPKPAMPNSYSECYQWKGKFEVRK